MKNSPRSRPAKLAKTTKSKNGKNVHNQTAKAWYPEKHHANFLFRIFISRKIVNMERTLRDGLFWEKISEYYAAWARSKEITVL